MIIDEVCVYFAMRAGRPIVYLETQKKGKKLILLLWNCRLFFFDLCFLFFIFICCPPTCLPFIGLDQALHTRSVFLVRENQKAVSVVFLYQKNRPNPFIYLNKIILG